MAYDQSEEERVSYDRSVTALIEHTRIVQEALRAVLQTADGVEKRDATISSSAYKKVLELKEVEELNVRKRVEKTLAEAQLISNFAASLLATDDLITEISSFAEAVSFRLNAMTSEDFCLMLKNSDKESAEFINGITEVVNMAFEAFEKAKTALQSLKSDTRKAVQVTYEVDQIEAEVDHKQRQLDLMLLKYNFALPCILLMHETVQRAEEMVDSIQRFGSSVRILALMRGGMF
ncbi:MAG: hypothetical protein ACP5GO_03520 [Thermoprotei archaeon]